MFNLKKIIIFILFILLSINFSFGTTQVLGLVQDEYDNLFVGANLNFQCSGNDLNYDFPNKTNSYGGFELNNFNFNSCRIFASMEDKVGFIDIINNGSTIYKPLLLVNRQSVVEVPKSNFIFTFGFLVLISIIFIILIFIFKNFKNQNFKKVEYTVKENKKEINQLETQIKKDEEKIRDDEKKIEEFEKDKKEQIKIRNNITRDNTQTKNEIIMTSWMYDLIQTLNRNEKDIVETLIDLNGVATATKIRIKTGLPKTTVFRILNSLEKKKIIEFEDFSNMKKAKLTNFFLKH